MATREPNEREARRLTHSISRLQPFAEQRAAILALAQEPGRVSRSVLLELLTHRDASVRGAALEACAEVGGSLGLVAARALSSDPDPSLRGDALHVLGDQGNARDLPRLVNALEDPDWTVRSDAAENLEYLGLRRAVKPLLQAYRKERHPIVRRDIAIALGRIGAAEAIPVLEEALARPRGEQDRIGILQGLYWLGQRDRLSDLLAHLRSEDYHIRHAIINTTEALEHVDDRAIAAEALERMLPGEPSPPVRENAERVRAILLETVEE